MRAVPQRGRSTQIHEEIETMNAPFTMPSTRSRAARRLSLLTCLLAGNLLSATSQAAGYKFTSYQYPGADSTYFSGVDDTNRITGYAEIGGNAQAILLTSAGSGNLLSICLATFPFFPPPSTAWEVWSVMAGTVSAIPCSRIIPRASASLPARTTSNR